MAAELIKNAGIIWVFVVASLTICAQNVSAQGGPALQVPEEEPFYEKLYGQTIQPRYILPHDYRLPKGLVPEHYIVNIRPILDDGSIWEVDTAPGSVTMFVRCTENITLVTFNSNNITIDYDTVEIKDLGTGSTHTIHEHQEDTDNQIVVLELLAGQELRAGLNYSISLNFTSQVPWTLLGMYHRTYLTPEGQTKKMVLTKLEAVGARMVFPCFDEPALKATYQINVARTAAYNTLCNMEIERTTNDSEHNGWFWDEYFTTVKMSTYLIAIVVSEFMEVKAAGGIYPKAVSTWAAPHHISAGGGEYAANDTALVLKYFTELYDLEYPLPKMDSAAIPQFSSGAMEQWGLITYRWDNLWLNEGFARHIEKVGVDGTHPEFEANLFAVSIARINAMTADNGLTTKPVHYNGDNLSGIVYDKASSLIRMMESYLTKPTFLKAIRRYLKAHMYRNANQDNLFEQLTIAGHEDGTLNQSLSVKYIMDTWTRQTGFPLVRVGRIASDRIYVTQERFGKISPIIEAPILNPSEFWTIPLSFATTDNPDFTASNQRPRIWLDKTTTFETVPLSTADSDWVIANVDATAYYRVIYDEHLTRALKTQLDTNSTVISPATRSQIMDDYFRAAFEKYIPIETALGFTTFLNKESTLVVWQTFFTTFRPSYVLLNGHSAHASEFKEYISEKLIEALGLVGERQLPNHKGANVLVRVQLMDWACSLGLDVCTDYAKELLEEWTKNPIATGSPVPVDIRPSIYCAMVWSGGKPAKDFFLKLYREETVKVWPNNLKPIFRNALACASEVDVIDELLNLTLSSNVIMPKEDALELLVRFAGSSVGRLKLTGFIEQNLVQIINYHGVKAVETIITAQAAHWSEIEMIDNLNNFINTNSARLTEILPGLRRAVQTIQTNFKWMEEFGNTMGEWFIKNQKESSGLRPVPASIFGLLVPLVIIKFFA